MNALLCSLSVSNDQDSLVIIRIFPLKIRVVVTASIEREILGAKTGRRGC
jgi:hypothetical protein